MTAARPLALAPRSGGRLLGVVVASSHGLNPPVVYAVGAAVLVFAVAVATLVGRRLGRRALSQRLTALGSRLGIDTPQEDTNIEAALSYLEQVTGAATEAVADSSADAIRLRRSLDTLPQGVVLCDESGTVVYRNARANALMTSRQGDALAAQAVTELLEDAWDQGSAERTLDLYGPPRRTLTVRARLIDDGRRPLGVIAMIEDVSERRRLEEIRRDFVANVSHELKTPMGALGLLAETLVAEPDTEVARRLASRIHTEAFRVNRIIDDLLDLSRIESEEAPPREPVLVNLVMAEAVERVRASADQRGIGITLAEPDPPVAVLGDRRQLVSAMHALIENAVTYSYDGAVVSVSGHVARASEAGAPDRPLGGALGAAPSGAPFPATLAATVVASPPLAPLASVPSASTAPLGPGAPTGAPGLPLTAGATAGALSAPNEHLAVPATDRGLDGLATDRGFGVTTEDILGTRGAPPVSSPNGHGGRETWTPAEAGASDPVDPVESVDQVESVESADERVPFDFAAAGPSLAPPNGPPGTASTPPTPPGGTPVPLPGAHRAEASEPVDSGTWSASTAAGADSAGRHGDLLARTPVRDTVRLSVVDHGVGIPARDLDRIFERFYRVDHGRSRDTGGTGLGLSIVRHVANNHQGWVEVESREGEGSTFTLVLPLQSERPA